MVLTLKSTLAIMRKRIKKIITPLIIVPLITGGFVGFVALSLQSGDMPEFISAAKPFSSEAFSLGAHGPVIRLILATFAIPVPALATLILLSLLLWAYILRIRSATLSQIRNRSPPVSLDVM